ncbi:MAG: cell division transport system permease protein [Ilumatobacteraceae bacterium]|jgi:cell division transport system permease protein
MISRLRYTLREMWASLSRNLTLTVAAVITSMVSLFLFGMTLLIQQAFDNQLSQWTGGVKMIVYVKNGTADDAVATIEQALKSRPEIIKNVQYCSVQCSFAQAQKLFAADPESLKFLSEKNVPSYFAVEPVDKQSIVQLVSIRDSFTQLPGVRSADFPSDQITVLGKLKSFFGVRTYVMSGVLLFASILLIWNTIRTAMFARRREIEVMKLVGATNWFIRLPFMLEGLLQGLAGAALGSVLLLLGNADWTSGVRRFPSEAGLGGFVVTDGYPIRVVIFMVMLGAFVGAVGSATAASRFLDV